MRIVNEPTEIEGLRVVQDEYEIAKALENGEKLPFAELKPRGRYVDIK